MDNLSQTNAGTLQLRMATADDILRDAVKNYRENSNTNQAAAIAFYAILSLIPLFVLTVIVLGRVFSSHPGIQDNLLQVLQGIHPYFSAAFFNQLGHIEQKEIVLGWAGTISLVWLSAMIFSAIEKALNIIFRARTRRNYFVAKLLALSMIPMGWAVGIASVGITYGASFLARQHLIAGNVSFLSTLIHGSFFGYLIPYLLTAAFVSVLYKTIPNVAISTTAAFTGGAIFAVMVEMAKHVFAWYVSNYTRYNVIFGSLETVVLLIIWVFYVALIFLFCAELVASYQRRDLLLLKGAFLEKGSGHSQMSERLFRKFGRKFNAGTHIFREGDTNREMYYLLKGRVLVEKRTGEITKVLAEMGPGEYLGEMAALIESPRSASALVTEDSHVAVIDADTFRNLLRESGEISLFMLREFSYRIIRGNEALEKLDQARLDLMIIMYFFREWPFRKGIDHIGQMAKYTGKEPQEIRQALERLARRHILLMQDGLITDFCKEDAWSPAEGQ